MLGFTGRVTEGEGRKGQFCVGSCQCSARAVEMIQHLVCRPNFTPR